MDGVAVGLAGFNDLDVSVRDLTDHKCGFSWGEINRGVVDGEDVFAG